MDGNQQEARRIIVNGKEESQRPVYTELVDYVDLVSPEVGFLYIKFLSNISLFFNFQCCKFKNSQGNNGHMNSIASFSFMIDKNCLFFQAVLVKEEPEDEAAQAVRRDQQSINQNPETAKSTNLKKGGSDEELVPFIPMRYRNFRLQIYKKLGPPTRFFYEPALLLDPQKIQSQVNKTTGKAYIRFPVQMWDEELEEQVVNWLKNHPDIHNDKADNYCVQVMPYDGLRLVPSGDLATSGDYHPSKQATSYRQLDQGLQFHLFSETKEAADSLVETFQTDPNFHIQDLTLECVTIKSASTAGKSKRPRIETADSVAVRSSKILRFNVNLCNASASSPRPPPDDNSNPQVLEDFSVHRMDDALKGPCFAVKVSFILLGITKTNICSLIIFFVRLILGHFHSDRIVQGCPNRWCCSVLLESYKIQNSSHECRGSTIRQPNGTKDDDSGQTYA